MASIQRWESSTKILVVKRYHLPTAESLLTQMILNTQKETEIYRNPIPYI